MTEKRRPKIGSPHRIERRRMRIHRAMYAILWFCLGFYVSEATHKAHEIIHTLGLH